MVGRYPDFIIGGAPKCGTTSLHFILDQHPDIGLPEDEIHYFDADDPITHPDFFFRKGEDLLHYDNRGENAAFREQYAATFAPFAECDLVGEDSTTYLLSEVAPARIRALLPEVRLIFMLRDPVARAYSQYWHMVTRARTACTFEEAIYSRSAIVRGSTYLSHLQRYKAVFGLGQIKIVLFEDFIAEKQAVIDDVTDFLGATRMTVSPEASWFNRSYYPTWLTGQLLLNRIGKHVVGQRYARHLGSRDGWRVRFGQKIHHFWFRQINPIFLKAERPPPMREGTRAYLADHLSRRNEGLSDFLGRDLSQVWKGFDG